LGFLDGQERHDASLEALGRDAEYPPDHGCVLWMAHGGVLKEGPDRSEPQVSRPSAVVPLGLEVFEERGDQRLVEVRPVQRGGCFAGGVLHEAQQQYQ